MNPLFHFILWLVILYFYESRSALRITHDSKPRRAVINLLYFFTNVAASRLLFIFFLVWAEKYSFEESTPSFGRSLLLLLILDLMLYYWHRVNHQIPFFWKFHSLHHSDRDMDVTTAFRFHFGEFFFSYLIKAFLVFFLGITVKEILFFDSMAMAFVMFHHSNIKLPDSLEKILGYVIVTPKYHHIHHSNENSEMNSHFSVIFSFWDKIHRTNKELRPIEKMEMGLKEFEKTPNLIAGWKQGF